MGFLREMLGLLPPEYRHITNCRKRDECKQVYCAWYWRGFIDGHGGGYEAGLQQGRIEGRQQGYADGYAQSQAGANYA
jgi:hypothetical protein